MTDIIYWRVGLYTLFYPLTKDGEYIFNVMGGEPILTIREKNVLAQIRKAGYFIRKKRKGFYKEEIPATEIEELLK